MWAACAHVSLLDYIDGHFGINTTTHAYERWYAAYHACHIEVNDYLKRFFVDSGECTGYSSKNILMPTITWPTGPPAPVNPPIAPPVGPPVAKHYPVGGIYTMEGGNPIYSPGTPA